VLEVRLIDRVAVDVDGEAVAVPPGRALELLAWLAARPGRHARTTLAPIFWPDVADETARASLRTAIWSLRKALGPAADLLHADRSTVGLEDDAHVDLRQRRAGATDSVDAAIVASEGALLPGIEAEWADELRAEHTAFVVKALLDTGVAAPPADALAAARRLAELDPFSEDHHRLLLRRLVDAGDRASALREHDRFRRRLWDELRVRPSAPTRDLVATLGDGAAAPDDAALPPPLVRAGRDVFVGRASQRDALARAWDTVRAGRGPHLVLVSGQSGIGKTRLVARFAADVAGDATVLFGAAAEDQLLPAEPFLEAIGEHQAAAPAELVDLVRDRLDAVAATRPVLLVLDDLQWADTTSLALLRRVVRGGARHLLIVAAVRSDGDGRARLAPIATELDRSGQLTRIELGPLTRPETTALLGELDPDGELATRSAQVFADTGGNPLFVVELGRYLLAAPADERGAVPESVRDLVLSRLHELPTDAAEVVGAAAVLGMTVELDVLRRMTPGHDSLSAMEQACAAGLVDEQAAGTYAFRHAVIRDAVDEALSRSRRADLHRRAADAIEERAAGRDGAHLCDIAEHRCAATPPADPDVALAATRAATAWAMERHAYDRAVVVLTKALPLAEGTDRRTLTVERARAYARLSHMLIDGEGS
jgi:DNA-binding SARP family transcriptional activator